MTTLHSRAIVRMVMSRPRTCRGAWIETGGLEHARTRRKRTDHSGCFWHTDGPYHAQVLDASVAGVGAAGTRLPAGARPAAGRRSRGLSGHAGPYRPPRRVLPASARLAVFWP